MYASFPESRICDCASSSPIPAVNEPFRLNLMRIELGRRYGSTAGGIVAKDTVE